MDKMRLLVNSLLALVAIGMVASVANAAPPLPAPEIDPGSAAGAVALLTGAIAIMIGRARKG